MTDIGMSIGLLTKLTAQELLDHFTANLYNAESLLALVEIRRRLEKLEALESGSIVQVRMEKGQ